ncbi:MAG: tetratricopeptide repeat protein [Deltaproteobacteria bacterium]|nr:tetratricopeptide repeat protein [Deltaproteobacteria bacterium]
MAQAQYLRGTALAILGQTPAAIAAFESCRKIAAKAEGRTKQARREQDDLESRCLAGLARSHYEARQYDKAEEIYDEIPKSSFVWTDILFEQAWNAFAKGDHNRALGKLVTYRSPSLAFVFNPEVDVLRAQAFLSLCLYDDVNRSVNEFNSAYSSVGGRMKNFLLQNEKNLPAFHALAKRTFFAKLHSPDMMNRALNRFIRGPYYASLIAQERATAREEKRIRGYYPRADGFQGGFGGFLDKVLEWRKKSISLLGGLYVKNSLYDLYQELLADFDKMSFVKLDMLGKAKARLERKAAMSEDEDGVLKKGKASIDRRDYQYFFTFNGEFWSDELGDYVFALESECGQ